MSYAPQICPNIRCQFHLPNPDARFIKKGFYYVRRLNQRFRKYRCKGCKRNFSSRSFKADYRHKKMDLNAIMANLLVEGVSLRGIARALDLTYNNTYKKFLWFRKLVDEEKKKLHYAAKILQFDEMETIHHTKCKPLSIVVVVNEKYQLLIAKVAEIPAKGRLAEFSRRKYGMRKNERAQKIHEAFLEVKDRLETSPVLVKSDAHPVYKKIVTQHFPNIRYEQRSRRPDKNKLQERLHEKLHKKRFDPIFAVNHKCALLRDRIKRLVRRSWCTTKKVENLQLHLDILVMMQFGMKI